MAKLRQLHLRDTRGRPRAEVTLVEVRPLSQVEEHIARPLQRAMPADADRHIGLPQNASNTTLPAGEPSSARTPAPRDLLQQTLARCPTT